MEDLYCLLGPSIGFNREILLWRRSLQDHWTLPDAEKVQAFFHFFDLSDAPRAAPIDFERRPSTAQTPPIQLHAEYLGRERFERIHERMVSHAPESWCFKQYREIICRSRVCDWQTLGAIMFLFHHLDK